MDYRHLTSGEKVVAFDLDHTLIKPKTTKFPKNRDDAVLVFPEITAKIEQLLADDYTLVIFTNQRGIPKKITLEDIYHRIDNYVPHGKKFNVYISYKYDRYRKPSPGMLDEFMENNGTITDIVYVGDAAGRKKDFSASDAQFAHNCGIEFKTPEQYFLNNDDGGLPVIPHLKAPKPIPMGFHFNPKTILILMGFPGSGKSTLARKLADTHPGTVIISNDTSGNADKSLRLFRQALDDDETQRIIVDNTNPTVMNRVPFIEAAKDHDYKVIGVHVAIDRETAQHLNWYRCYHNDCILIPEIAYRMYASRSEPVTETEGYDIFKKYVPKLPKKIFEYSFA